MHAWSVGDHLTHRFNPELYDVVAVDADGRARPDGADAFRRPGLRADRMKNETMAAHDWPTLVRDLGARLDAGRRPYAVAAIEVSNG